MISVKDNSQKELLESFYAKPFSISYSGLSKLAYSPALFYKYYILNEREESLEQHLVEGKLVHCLLLEDGSFEEKFILMPTSFPTPNTKKAVDKMYAMSLVPETSRGENLEDYAEEILLYLKEINLHQSLKDDVKPDKSGKQLTGDQKRLEKMITEESLSYWEFLKIRGSKNLVTESMLETAREAVDALRNHESVQELLGIYSDPTKPIDVFNEVMLDAELADYPFKIHGILDNIKLDHELKKIFVNDIKRTHRSLLDFKETVEVYKYWIQAPIYMRLVYNKFYNLLEKGYETVFNFVVIDKYNQVYPFEVSSETMEKWQLGLEEELEKAKWHYVNRKYDLPYDLAIGTMKL